MATPLPPDDDFESDDLRYRSLTRILALFGEFAPAFEPQSPELHLVSSYLIRDIPSILTRTSQEEISIGVPLAETEKSDYDAVIVSSGGLLNGAQEEDFQPSKGQTETSSVVDSAPGATGELKEFLVGSQVNQDFDLENLAISAGQRAQDVPPLASGSAPGAIEEDKESLAASQIAEDFAFGDLAISDDQRAQDVPHLASGSAPGVTDEDKESLAGSQVDQDFGLENLKISDDQSAQDVSAPASGSAPGATDNGLEMTDDQREYSLVFREQSFLEHVLGVQYLLNSIYDPLTPKKEKLEMGALLRRHTILHCLPKMVANLETYQEQHQYFISGPAPRWSDSLRQLGHVTVPARQLHSFVGSVQALYNKIFEWFQKDTMVWQLMVVEFRRLVQNEKTGATGRMKVSHGSILTKWAPVIHRSVGAMVKRIRECVARLHNARTAFWAIEEFSAADFWAMADELKLLNVLQDMLAHTFRDLGPIFEEYINAVGVAWRKANGGYIVFGAPKASDILGVLCQDSVVSSRVEGISRVHHRNCDYQATQFLAGMDARTVELDKEAPADDKVEDWKQTIRGLYEGTQNQFGEFHIQRLEIATRRFSEILRVLHSNKTDGRVHPEGHIAATIAIPPPAIVSPALAAFRRKIAAENAAFPPLPPFLVATSNKKVCTGCALLLQARVGFDQMLSPLAVKSTTHRACALPKDCPVEIRKAAIRYLENMLMDLFLNEHFWVTLQESE
ncbi:hypothetical protein K402DRAFT_415917 [Aulographum hederae CBS 113979]|uniref:Uncharacterized protein n=1 Tax=Aulographum hederae CBS 113979 TaxID=1176131 RepID=A0A6G1HGR2_9PEZI|nr:hypothetical protein K402DRAFT_415917 [Aulographum hederae CBS 113979]